MTLKLTKSQPSINLTKAAPGLTHILVGLGWDPAKQVLFHMSKNIDLDANAIELRGGEVVDAVYYAALTSRDGAIQHSSDNLTGEGDGDDETMSINLKALDATVDAVAITVTSYKGHTFDKIANAYVRVEDESTGQELARFDLEAGDYTATTGQIMGLLKREAGEWKFQAVGKPVNGRTVKDHFQAAANLNSN